MVLFSEIVWVVLYCYVVIAGVTNDDIILTSTSFFFLALAGLEFCTGFLIIIFFKNFKKTLDTSINSYRTKNFKQICF